MASPEDLSDLVHRAEDMRASGDESPPPPGRGETASEGSDRSPRPWWRRTPAVIACIAAGVLLVGGGAWAVIAATNGQPTTARPTPSSSPSPAQSPTPTPTPVPTPTPTPTPEPEAAAPVWSLDDPNSIQVVVNKQRPLNPADWEPSDLVMPAGIPNSNGQPLRAEAAAALELMHADASAQGLSLVITSAFRSYGLQTSLFDSYAARDGLEAAETYSARPSHSEHQTGLAVDLDDGSGCAFMDCFGDTASGQWLRANAHSYGFILRYDQGQEPVVGYIYEPWHFRYVGTEVAADMQSKGIVNLEEYFGLPAAPTYIG